MGIGTFESLIMSHLNQEGNSKLNRYGDNVFPFSIINIYIVMSAFM